MQYLSQRSVRTFFGVVLLTFLLFALNWLGKAGTGASALSLQLNPNPNLNLNAPQFLNDRAADLAGTSPLAVKDFVSAGGLTGKGQVVGLADSGLDLGDLHNIHPDLQNQPGEMPKVVLLKSWTNRKIPDDPVGHGTHMAATVAGTGKASEGQFKGIAPGASIYFQALLDGGTRLEAPADLKQLFYPAYSAGVRIHINGWGGGANAYGGNSAQIDSFIRNYPDFLPIIAVGNSGPSDKSLTSEANSKNALVVGASQSVRPALSPDATDASQAASFSSRGPAGDGRLKPDLVAPGSAIISASSQLVESNFISNPLYTRMAGSSMAAAVAGGASVLLREWFQVGEDRSNPSAALLKAALINGARLPSGGPNDTLGFGVLDLTGTVLALKEGHFLYEEEKEGAEAGKFQEYRYLVKDQAAPFKATLVWTDPAAAAAAGTNKALVNDLDLLVIGPQGEQYRGNAGLSAGGQPDTVNNTEQVFIPKPAPGEYRIRVWGRNIQVPAAETEDNRLAQDFALVYGQPVQEGIVDRVSAAGSITLSTKDEVRLTNDQLKMVRDGKLVASSPGQILPGAQLYQTSRSGYLINRTWQAGGIQVLPTSKGPLFMEIDNAVREGGFYLDPDSEHPIRLNQSEVRQITEIPSGVEVSASLNPATQTLWQAAAGYQEIKGLVLKVDLEKKQISLVSGSQPVQTYQQTYQLSPWAAVSIMDQVIEAGPADAVYGGGGTASLEQVLPGMNVRLMLSPSTRQVQYLVVQRKLALGRVDQLDPDSRRLRLESGAELTMFEGAAIIRDREESSLKDIKPGDYVLAVVIPGPGEMWSAAHLTANTSVAFGRIIYWSEKQKTLYLADHLNQFRTVRLTGETQIYRWGMPVELSSLQSGAWIRLTTRPGSDEVWRIDMAEPAREEEQKIANYDADQQLLTFADGTSSPVLPTTLITKNGYWVGPEDLAAGERARLGWLEGPDNWPAVLASVEASPSYEAESPRLEILAQKQGGIVRITGNTTANRLYLYRNDGQREVIPIGGEGHFVWYFDYEANETAVKLLALDRRTGGVRGCPVEINLLAPFGFTDIEGHWAAKQIASLSRRGTLSGYLDGTFQPDRPVSRAELASLLVRVSGWPEQLAVKLDCSDQDLLPYWARNSVAAVNAQGLMVGYPDGSFRPQSGVSRGELAVVITRLLSQPELPDRKAGSAGNTETTGNTGTTGAASPLLSLPASVSARETSMPVYNDLTGLPRWMRSSVNQAALGGFMEGRSPGYFEPYVPATRAETAVALYRVIEELGL